MARFWLLLFLIAALTSVAQLFLPWWSLVPVCLLLAAWRGSSAWLAFLVGLLGTGLSWWLPALWLNTHGAERLASRLASLFPLGGNAWTLALLSGLIAGLVGGLAALTGYWARQALAPATAPTPVSSEI
ncbi:hypothetical protein [Hymenobacter tenuis]